MIFREVSQTGGSARKEGAETRLIAPMNGRVVALHAKKGDSVKKGQCLVVVEAMKIQHEIAAAMAGTVEQIMVREGEQVAPRQLLVELKKAE